MKYLFLVTLFILAGCNNSESIWQSNYYALTETVYPESVTVEMIDCTNFDDSIVQAKLDREMESKNIHLGYSEFMCRNLSSHPIKMKEFWHIQGCEWCDLEVFARTIGADKIYWFRRYSHTNNEIETDITTHTTTENTQVSGNVGGENINLYGTTTNTENIPVTSTKTVDLYNYIVHYFRTIDVEYQIIQE